MDTVQSDPFGGLILPNEIAVADSGVDHKNKSFVIRVGRQEHSIHTLLPNFNYMRG